MTIYETPIKQRVGLKYKIQLRCNDGVWEQRHVWYPARGTYVSKETPEAWVRSIQKGNPGPEYTEARP